MKNTYFLENDYKMKSGAYSPARGFRNVWQLLCFTKHEKTTNCEKLIPGALPVSKQKLIKIVNFTKSKKYEFWRKYLLLKVKWISFVFLFVTKKSKTSKIWTSEESSNLGGSLFFFQMWGIWLLIYCTYYCFAVEKI